MVFGIPVCGDGIKNSNEGCDDGNTTTSDGCSWQKHSPIVVLKY